MGKFSFSRNSYRRMDGVCKWLSLTAIKALEMSDILDFGVGPYGGYRTAEVQNQLFNKKRSKADGYNKKSYHQTGLALDLVPWLDGKFTWENDAAFREIKRLMFDAWEKLQYEGKIPKDKYLWWGGYFSTIYDPPHFEIRDYKQNRK